MNGYMTNNNNVQLILRKNVNHAAYLLAHLLILYLFLYSIFLILINMTEKRSLRVRIFGMYHQDKSL